MKGKKGIIKEETVKVLIAVVAIVILLYLAYSLYSIVQGSKEKEQAGEIAKQIADKVNNMKTGEEIMTITGPRNWNLLTEGKLLCVCKFEKESCKADTKICTSIRDDISLEITGGKISIYTKDITIKKENEKISISPRK
jgi:hypothetical protein